MNKFKFIRDLIITLDSFCHNSKDRDLRSWSEETKKEFKELIQPILLGYLNQRIEESEINILGTEKYTFKRVPCRIGTYDFEDKNIITIFEKIYSFSEECLDFSNIIKCESEIDVQQKDGKICLFLEVFYLED